MAPMISGFRDGERERGSGTDGLKYERIQKGRKRGRGEGEIETDGENKGGEGETEEEKDGEMKDGGNEAAIDKNKD